MIRYQFKSIIVLVFILFFSVFGAYSQGYNIKIKIKNLPNSAVILGHYFSDRMIPDDTAFLDATGAGAFIGKTPLPGGMYIVYLPNRTYFDVFVDKNQNFSVQNDTTNFVENMVLQGSPENDIFHNYQKFVSSKNQRAEQLKAAKTQAGANVAQIDAELAKLDAEVRTELNRITTENKGSIFADFLKATLDVEVPESVPDDKKFWYYLDHYFDNMPLSDFRMIRTPIYEKKIQNYLNLLNQLPPDSIISRVEKLFTAVGINSAPGQRNEEVFRYWLVTVHNFYASSQIMGHDAVFVYIAEKHYLPKAYWADSEYVKKLKDSVAKKKPNLIGNKAPKLVMQTLSTDTVFINKLIAKTLEFQKTGYDAHYNLVMQKSTDAELKKQLAEAGSNLSKRNKVLQKNREKKEKNAVEKDIETALYKELVTRFESIYNMIDENNKGFVATDQIKADQILIWFWEPDCSHCQKATPEVQKFYVKFNQLTYRSDLKNLETFAVYLPRGIEDWENFTNSLKHWFDFVKKNNLTVWHNTWDPYGETNFRELYDVYSTPVSYLLDPDGKIIAKRVEPQAIRRIMFERWFSFLLEKNDDNLLDAEMNKALKLFTTKEELEDLKLVAETWLKDAAKEKYVAKISALIPKE